MDEQAIDQRQDDVTAFLDQIESKMGKPTIDGLVSKLKMKPVRFISFLKETVITQFGSNGHGNWSAKKKLNLLYILNKYLQDPVKRKEAHDWTEAFRCILLSVIPEMQDLRDAQHVSKLLKHWTRDSSFPSDMLDEWQRLSDHHLQLLEKNAASASSEQNTAALISQPPRSAVSDEHRKRSSSYVETQIVDAQSEVRDQYMSMMRKFLYEAYRHFCRAAVSLNDTLHWRVVITSSFWLLNQYLLQEFYSGPIDVKALESKKLDDPLAVCLSCIYLSGKAEQYFIRSEKLRVVAQKYMSIYFTGVSHPFSALQNPASMEGRSSSGIPSLPGDAALFAMELKLLRLIDYDISEIANPCRTLRDWLLFKRVPPETFQKVTSMFCKEDHLSGHFNYGMDAFDHDNVLAFFMILAETKFPQEDEPSSANVDQSDVLKESIEKVFQSCEVFKELNWTSSLLDMVLTVQSKPLNEIGVQNSARFVKTFLTLWDKYYQEHCDRKPALKPVVITPAETSLSSSIVPEATSVQLPLELPKESVEVVKSSNMSSHIDDHVFPRATLGKRFRSDSNQSNDSRSRGNSQRESHDTRGSYGFGHNDHSSSNSARDHLRHDDHQQNRSRAPSDQRFQRDDRLHGNAPPSSHSNHPPQRDDHQSRLNAQPDHGFPRGNGQSSNPSTLYRGQMDNQSHRNDRPSVYGPQTGNVNQPLQRVDHQSQSRNQSDHRFHRDEGLSNRNDVHAGHIGNASHHNDRPNDRPNSYQNNRPNVNGPQTTQGNHYSQRNDDQHRTKPQTDGRFPRDDAHSGHYGRTNDRPNAYGPPVNGGNHHNQRDGPPARSQNDHRFQRDEGHLHQSKQVQSGAMGLTSYGDERQQRPGPSSSHVHHPAQRVDQQTRNRSDSGHGFPPDSNLSNQKSMHQGSVGHNFHRNDRPNAYGPPTASANPPRDDHQSRSRSDSGHQVRHDHSQPRNDSLSRPNNAPHDRFNSGQRNTFQPPPSQGQFNQNRPPGGFRQSTEVPQRGKIDDFPPGNDRFGRTDRPFEANDMSPYGPRSQGSTAPALNTHHESTVRKPSAYGQPSARFEPGNDRVEDASQLRDNQRANPRAGYNHPPFRSDFCVEVKDDRVSPEDNSGPMQSSPPRDFWEHVAREASQPIHRVVSQAEGEGEGKLHAPSPSLNNAVTVPSIIKKDTVETVVQENNLPSSGGKAANVFRDPSPPAKYQLNEEPVQLHVTVPAPNFVTCTMKEFQPQTAEAPIDLPFSATQDPTVKLSRESSTTSVGVGKLPGFPRSLLSVAIGSLVRKGPERSYSSVVASASPLRPEVTKATVSSIEEGEVFEDNRDANDKHRPAVDRGEADEPANKRRKIEEVVVPSKPIQQQQQRQSVQQPPQQQQHQEQQQYQHQHQQQRRRFQGQQRNQHHQPQHQQQNQQHHQPQHHHQQNQQHNRNKGPQHNNSHAHGNVAQRNNVPAGRQVFFNANQHHNGRNQQQQQHHGH